MAEGRKSAASSAAEQVQAIVAAAEQSAEQIRAQAERDVTEARAAVERVGERTDELERRLDALLEGVREGVAALRAELEELRGGEAEEPAAERPLPAAAEVDEELIAETEELAAKEPEVEPAVEDSSHPEGARVLALKMALDGAPREDTARYLRENFTLDDPDGLLDEVYAKLAR